MCVQTFDSDFLLDYDPERPGLFIATGGSGHGVKFAPLLGEIIADRVERKVRVGWLGCSR